MNQNEKVFYDSLIKKGIEKDRIKFFSRDSPDFIVEDIGYEVKRKFEGIISLNKRQINKILSKKLKSFFLITVDEEYILEEIPLTKDILDKEFIGNTSINWEDENVVPFFQNISPEVIHDWKETMTRNETIRGRLEEALKDNAEKHKGKK